MILQHAARNVGKGLTRGAVSRVVAPISFPSPSSSSSLSPSPSPSSSSSSLHHFPAPYRTSSLQFYSSSSTPSTSSFISRPLSTLSASSASSSVLPTFLRRSLKEPLPQFIEDPSSSSFSSSLSKAPETRVTTLPNGVRLASREHYGVTATLGAHLALGTCDEEPHQYGVAHLLERMTFKSTTKETSEEIVKRLDFMGSNCMALTSREVTTVFLEGLRDNAPEMLTTLGAGLLESRYDPSEVMEILPGIEADFTNQMNNPENILFETMFVGAFGEQTPLGHSIRCHPEAVEEFAKNGSIKEFVKTHFIGPRIVITACGLEHEEFVKLATPIFSKIPALSPSTDIPTYSSETKPLLSPYVGGAALFYDAPEPEPVPAQQPGEQIGQPQQYAEVPRTQSMFVVAFEAPGAREQDFYATCVLNALLGGGSSFSSGGPGKGMYSRLYKRVLDRYQWVEHASAFVFPFKHCSLFGLYCKSDEGTQLRMFDVVRRELTALLGTPSTSDIASSWIQKKLGNRSSVSTTYEGITDEEFLRAKNSLKGAIYQTLESRLMLFDEIGKRLITCGEILSPEQICQEIDKLTIPDVQRVAARILSSPPTIVVIGSAKDNQQTQTNVNATNMQAYFKEIISSRK